MKNPYKVLGVTRKATKDEIKSAYRELCKEHHPDKNDGKNSEEFLEIQEAYDILMDDEKREYFDNTGEIKKEQNKQEKIIGTISMLFCECVTNRSVDLSKLDIVSHIKKYVLSEQMKILKQIEDIQWQISRFDESHKRIKGKDDFFKALAEGQIRGLEKRIESLNVEHDFGDEILDFISNYSYEVGKILTKLVENLFSGVTLTEKDPPPVE